MAFEQMENGILIDFEQFFAAVAVLICTVIFALIIGKPGNGGKRRPKLVSKLPIFNKDKQQDSTINVTDKNSIPTEPIKSSQGVQNDQQTLTNKQISEGKDLISESDLQSEHKEQSDESTSVFLKQYRDLIDQYSQHSQDIKTNTTQNTQNIQNIQNKQDIQDIQGTSDPKKEKLIDWNVACGKWKPKPENQIKDTLKNTVNETENNSITENVHVDKKNENIADRFTKGAVFNLSEIIKNSENKNKKYSKKLPQVEQLGSISLEKLNEFDCESNRQCVSILGTIFDVSGAQYKYGKDGSYRSFAGHDITLALGSGKLDEKWLDRFVKLSMKQQSSVEGWMSLYERQYPICGTLDKWDDDISKWPNVTQQEREELNAECSVM